MYVLQLLACQTNLFSGMQSSGYPRMWLPERILECVRLNIVIQLRSGTQLCNCIPDCACPTTSDYHPVRSCPTAFLNFQHSADPGIDPGTQLPDYIPERSPDCVGKERVFRPRSGMRSSDYVPGCSYPIALRNVVVRLRSGMDTHHPERSWTTTFWSAVGRPHLGT